MLGAIFSIASLIYLIIFIINFFSKEKINNVETKLYGYIIIISFIGTFIDILGFALYKFNVDYNSIIYIAISKIMLLYFLSWITLFTYYIYSISKNFVLKQQKTIIFTLYILFVLSVIILPIHFQVGKNAIYPNGLGVTLTYIYISFMIIMNTILTIENIKTISFKKYFPVICVIGLIFISMLIQKLFPDLFLINFSLSLIVSIMYFTIENPDVKMIEQLNKARDEAVKANQAKTDFLSSMSHEIRTPLNAICGFSNSLLESDGVSTEAKSDVKNIIMASDTLLELVNGILDISKIEANKLEIVDTVYSFKKMYEELILLTKARIGEKPIEFKHSYDESIPEFLYGDGVRVKQVIINLLTNSAKYTKSGYIDFKINSIRKDNIIRLIISVEDSGIGIKKESIEKLFTKFERLGVEKETTTEGTGLGLAITKKLVEMMGGKIVVQSIYGKGSIFTISLDQRMLNEKELEKVIKAKETEEKTSEIIDASNKNVLVVDDNVLNLKVAERLLKAYKCNITLVGSGSECLDKVSNNKYDLILLDDMMPKMTGTETLQKLKEIETFNTPVVALTANALTGMKEEYISRGFNDYLSKPIEKEDLNRVMKKYLKK